MVIINMHEQAIICESCGREYPATSKLSRCGSCGASLEVVFNYSMLRKSLSLAKIRKRPFNHSRYLDLYPVRRILSLGEGGTPLIRSSNLEKELGLKFELWFKLESQNPTGSFKDRGSSVEVARALEIGAKRVAVASTGNMGASVSAYSAVAGLSCHVFTPSDARPVKLRQILSYGARLYQVPGTYTEAASLVERLCKENRACLLGDYLFRREGTKSVGFEIADQLPGVDHVFCPVGNGTLISAVWKAYKEWNALGFSKGLPRMAGIQASGCSPITSALNKGTPIRPMEGKTIAVAIECGDPLDGSRALNSIRESRGFSGAVTDKEILKAREMLSRREGLFAEPAGAVSLAGLIKARKNVRSARRVVCIVTGHGLKAPHTPIGGRIERLRKGSDLSKLFN
jgi:threonine synthase